MIVRELAPDVSVGFRDMEPGDRKFILSSWLRNHRKAGDWPRRMARLLGEQAYYDAHTPVVEQLLERSVVRIACNPSDPRQIIGYVVFEPGPPGAEALHWVFVKSPFRHDPQVPRPERPRLGTALLDEAFLSRAVDRTLRPRCSHWTKSLRHTAVRWRVDYDPFLLEDLNARA